MGEGANHWGDIQKASEALGQLATATIAALNRYRASPTASSIASGELGGFADRLALQEAYDKGSRSLIVACDYAMALVRTLSMPILSVTPWACLRQILESCSMCIWMLDSSVGPEERAVRSLNVQFQENRSKLTFLQKNSAGTPEDQAGLSRLIQNANDRATQLRLQAQQLGIKEKLNNRGRFLGFGIGPILITDRIERSLKDIVSFDYSLLSPLAHGDTWAVLLLSSEIESQSLPRVVFRLDPFHAQILINNSFDSIAKGLRTYCEIFGYASAEYEQVLEPLQDSIRQATISILDSTD